LSASSARRGPPGGRRGPWPYAVRLFLIPSSVRVPCPTTQSGGAAVRRATSTVAPMRSCAPRASPATSRTAAGRASSSCGCTIATSLPSRQRFARALNPPRRRAHASDLAREIRHQQADVAAERYVITSQNVLAGPQARVSKPPVWRVERRRFTMCSPMPPSSAAS